MSRMPPMPRRWPSPCVTASSPRPVVCGFPDKLVVITINEVVVAMYGDEELINSFRDTLTASYPAAVIDFDEAIQ